MEAVPGLPQLKHMEGPKVMLGRASLRAWPLGPRNHQMFWELLPSTHGERPARVEQSPIRKARLQGLGWGHTSKVPLTLGVSLLGVRQSKVVRAPTCLVQEQVPGIEVPAQHPLLM